MNSIEQQKICAGIPYFFAKDPEFFERLCRLTSQVEHVYIYVNGAEESEKKQLQALKAGNITVTFGDKNIGPAGAFNDCAQKAKAAGYQWFMTLDQDTDYSENLVQSLSAQFASIENPEKLAILAPAWNKSLQKPQKIRWVICSGAIHKLEVFTKLGGYREDFLVDRLEAEYAIRLAKAGYETYIAPCKEIFHKVGEGREIRIMGSKFVYSNHSAWRRYLIARNSMIIFKENIFTSPKAALSELKNIISEKIKILLFERQKFAKLWALTKGFFAGLRCFSRAN